MSEEQRDARGEASLNRDHYGACYVIIDDVGDGVSEWIFDDLDKAKRERDGTPGWEKYRIVMCGYRTFADEPEVVDDPRTKPVVSKNVNCLEGVRCPKCGQEDTLRIEGRSVFEVIDDGTVSHADVEWCDDSWTLCPACEYEGKLGTFRT